MPETNIDFEKILPRATAGWTKTGPAKTYTPATLSTYIDGGAELYISYGFKKALSLKYADAAENEISVDIFDMGSSPDAFGVFAHSRETIDNAFGQGSEYAAGLLTFWKDRFYVSILAYPETPAKKDVVFELGRTIAKAIGSDGALPPIIALLPEENLIPESAKYFHHYVWLNSFYFVSNENVLDIGNDTPAALGKYRHPGGNLFLLLVRYPDEARAEAAGKKFGRQVLGGAADDIGPLKDGRFAGLRRLSGLLAVVFNAPDAPTVRAILAKTKE
ncbi:MAG: hypothetical protein FJY82_13150 [Candidatus Aminicenantes bacterium]|nr:hypothetical protein [Candidatus Aminicenantes bacterium]